MSAKKRKTILLDTRAQRNCVRRIVDAHDELNATIQRLEQEAQAAQEECQRTMKREFERLSRLVAGKPDLKEWGLDVSLLEEHNLAFLKAPPERPKGLAELMGAAPGSVRIQ